MVTNCSNRSMAFHHYEVDNFGTAHTPDAIKYAVILP
jgi:hypothetical protein